MYADCWNIQKKKKRSHTHSHTDGVEKRGDGEAKIPAYCMYAIF